MSRLLHLLLTLGLHGAVLAEDGHMEGASIAEFFGYADCIKLENATTRVVLGTSGGRVLEFAFQGENALMLDPAQAGWRYVPGQPVVEPSAGRCDVGPEQVIPRHPDLWFGDWKGEIIGPRLRVRRRIPTTHRRNSGALARDLGAGGDRPNT